MSTKLPSVQQVSVRARNSRGCFKPSPSACLPVGPPWTGEIRDAKSSLQGGSLFEERKQGIKLQLG